MPEYTHTGKWVDVVSGQLLSVSTSISTSIVANSSIDYRRSGKKRNSDAGSRTPAYPVRAGNPDRWTTTDILEIKI